MTDSSVTPPKKRILCVEDEPTLGNLYKVTLENAGYNVDIAPDGEEGLRMILTDKYDLIALNTLLPKMSGHEVLEKLQGVILKGKVGMLTNIYDDIHIAQALKFGISFYIVKQNYTADLFVKEIHNIINREGWYANYSQPAEELTRPDDDKADSISKIEHKTEEDKLRKQLLVVFKKHYEDNQAEKQVDAILRDSKLDNIRTWLVANDKMERDSKKYRHLLPEARKYVKDRVYICSNLRPMAMALSVGPTACKWLVKRLVYEGLLGYDIDNRNVVGWNVIHSPNMAPSEDSISKSRDPSTLLRTSPSTSSG